MVPEGGDVSERAADELTNRAFHPGNTTAAKEEKTVSSEEGAGDVRPWQMGQGLSGSEEQFRALIYALPDLVVVHQEGRIVFFNREALRASGRTAEEMYDMPMITDVAPADRATVLENSRRRLAGEKVGDYEIVVRTGSGELRNAIVRSTLITYKGRPATLTMLIDNTEKKRAEEERERLILELKNAFSKLKTLSGMLPICSSCKKIRDDKGYWEQIEVYIRDHTEADFSHGICPECAAKLYPGFFKER
jgi:PAS domain S-box-containing protein